jgi:hypothetical protein
VTTGIVTWELTVFIILAIVVLAVLAGVRLGRRK